jgi:hypothetical protein
MCWVVGIAKFYTGNSKFENRSSPPEDNQLRVGWGSSFGQPLPEFLIKSKASPCDLDIAALGANPFHHPALPHNQMWERSWDQFVGRCDRISRHRCGAEPAHDPTKFRLLKPYARPLKAA